MPMCFTHGVQVIVVFTENGVRVQGVVKGRGEREFECVCVCVCVCVYACVCVCTRAWVCVSMRACLQAYICVLTQKDQILNVNYFHITSFRKLNFILCLSITSEDMN